MKRRSTHDWRALVEAFESSGLSQAAFCREHGLNECHRSGTDGTVFL